ncbi:MAG: DUF5004 domain-containing protein [Parafilimonas sp.]
MKSLKKIIVFLSALSVLQIISCKTQKDSLVEPQKDLSGLWRISKVERNAAEITQWVDTTGFRLALQTDGTYTLQSNNIPFIVNTNGTWSADDPLYPFHLSFTATDSTTAKTGDITTPVQKGERNFEITFSPGCVQNTYVYTFTKISD